MATVDKSATTLDNIKQQAILAGETLLGDLSDSKQSKRKSSKHHSKRKSRSESSSDSELDSTESDSSTSSGSSSGRDSLGRGKKNSHRKGKSTASGSGESSIGKGLKEVWCTKCRNPGHMAPDCAMNEKWCAICTSNSHKTDGCFYNGRGRRSWESSAWQPPRKEKETTVAVVQSQPPDRTYSDPPENRGQGGGSRSRERRSWL